MPSTEKTQYTASRTKFARSEPAPAGQLGGFYMETSTARVGVWVCWSTAQSQPGCMPHPSSYVHSSVRWSADRSNWLCVRQFRADSIPETLSLVNPDLTLCTILPKKILQYPFTCIFPILCYISQPSISHTVFSLTPWKCPKDFTEHDNT